MTKSEAIKAAYGEYWERVKDYVEDNGWIELYSYNCYTDTVYTDLTEDLPFLKELGYERKYFNNGHTHYVRPKSLSGIETNNSWTRIESESDLPKEKGDYWVVWNGKIIVQYWFRDNPDNPYNDMVQNNQVFSWMQAVTHYQPIETPKPPIF
ncbi:TPA: hypothetical protein ACG0AT_000944 [Elizabethkingia anophelis]